MRGRRFTFTGKLLVVALVATVVISIVAPGIGLACAIVLALIGAFVLAEGFVGTSSDAGRETYAAVEAERKRDALSHIRR
jgi:hypothetical protein